MRDLLKNRQLLTRAGTVLSGIWVGCLFIASVLARNFNWFVEPYSYDAYIRGWPFGPALVTALAGIAVIYTVCQGLPWIVEASSTGDH